MSIVPPREVEMEPSMTTISNCSVLYTSKSLGE